MASSHAGQKECSSCFCWWVPKKDVGVTEQLSDAPAQDLQSPDEEEIFFSQSNKLTECLQTKEFPKVFAMSTG